MPDVYSLGWGMDPWGDGWWGSIFHWFEPGVDLGPDIHISHTKERPPVAPRARF